MQSELFQTHEDNSKIWEISELNASIRKVLEKNFSQVWIRGEVSNLKAHSSGHYYFQLKDHSAQIKAVLFRGDARNLSHPPKEGSQYLAFGDVTAYEPRGDYQIRVRHLMQDGVGNLRLEFERLKLLLEKEGLFQSENKKQIPSFPIRIGLITSPEGAAIHDFLTILKRRDWKGEVFLFPSLVQGHLAPASLIQAFGKIGQISPQLDLIVISRGGGSVEDLWAFNDEKLVRSIAASEIPVISAVGHQTDFVLSDFVADLRAETPSAAAELISSLYLEQIERFFILKNQLDEIYIGYFRSLNDQIELLQAKLKFGSPKNKIERSEQQLDDLQGRLRSAAKRILEKDSEKLHYLASRLEGSSLQNTLGKGFAFIRSQNGEIIKDGKSLSKNTKVSVTFRDGNRDMTAT
jgi:exodeoxyribonuclease VII large subunit